MQTARTTTLAMGAAPPCAGHLLPQAAPPAKAFAAPAFSTRKQRSQTLKISRSPSVAARAASADAKIDDNFIPVMRPEDLPKGVRKEVRVQGKSVLVFWYRNQIYAIEARSPAEGAYSEGFIRSKFTQDFCIECPTTGSLFSLKDGSVVTWYPNNFVLRALTPVSTCRNLEIYPVKLTQDAIGVDVSGGALQAGSANVTKGGSDTSLENNNVYGLEPKVYVEAGGAEVGGEPAVAKVATGVVFALAVTSVVVVALAVVKYVTS